jgi:2-haloacid dehalogenase
MSVEWVLFDLNGTLLDPTTIASPLGGSQAERQLVLDALDESICFAMAETLTHGYRPFSHHLRASLKRRLALAGQTPESLEAMMEVAQRMKPYPDAHDALVSLADAGLKLAVLTNSATVTAKKALADGGLMERFQHVIGTDQVQAFKPDLRVYRHGATTLGAAPHQVLFVASHGWDTFGAKRFGFQTGWLSFKEKELSDTVPKPDVQAENLGQLAVEIVASLNPAT